MSKLDDLIKRKQVQQSDTVHDTVAPIIYNTRTREKTEKEAKEGTERLKELRRQGKQAVFRPDYRTSDQRKRDDKEADYKHQQYQKTKDDQKRAEGFENLMKLSSPSTYAEAITEEELTPTGKLAFDVGVFGLAGGVKSLLTRGGSKAVSRSILGQARGINGIQLNPKNLGKYLAEGSEQTVYDGGDIVYKVYDQGAVFPTGEDLDRFVASYLKRNDFSLQVPVNYEGYIKGPRPGLPNQQVYFPVFSQKKVQPVTESWETLEPKVNSLLRKNGYNDAEEAGVFSNNKHTLIDIQPDNIGLDHGELRFIDIGVEPKYFSTQPITRANPVHTMEGNPLQTRLTRLQDHANYGTDIADQAILVKPVIHGNEVRNVAKQLEPSLSESDLDLITQIAYANKRGVHIPIENGNRTTGISIVDIQDAINYLKQSGVKNPNAYDVGIMAGHEAGHGVQVSPKAKQLVQDFIEPEEFYTRAGQILDDAGVFETSQNPVSFGKFMQFIDDYLKRGNLDNGISALKQYMQNISSPIKRQQVMGAINRFSVGTGSAYLLNNGLNE